MSLCELVSSMYFPALLLSSRVLNGFDCSPSCYMHSHIHFPFCQKESVIVVFLNGDMGSSSALVLFIVHDIMEFDMNIPTSLSSSYLEYIVGVLRKFVLCSFVCVYLVPKFKPMYVR
jgi:hypothetical protein